MRIDDTNRTLLEPVTFGCCTVTAPVTFARPARRISCSLARSLLRETGSRRFPPDEQTEIDVVLLHSPLVAAAGEDASKRFVYRFCMLLQVSHDSGQVPDLTEKRAKCLSRNRDASS